MLECMHIGGNMYFVKPMTVADALNVISVVQKYWALIEHCQVQLSMEAVHRRAA